METTYHCNRCEYGVTITSNKDFSQHPMCIDPRCDGIMQEVE